MICQFCLNQFAMNILQSTPQTCDTGLSNKTFICNFFLTVFKKCHPPMIFTSIHVSKPHKHTHTPLICSQKPPPVISGQFRTTTLQQILTDTQNGCLRMCGRHQMVVAGVFWCLMVSVSVSCHLEMWGRCLRSFSKSM